MSHATSDEFPDLTPVDPAPVSAVADAASLEPEDLPESVRTAIKMTVIERAQPARKYATHAISRDEMCNAMAMAAQKHDIPVAFFTSLIWQESNFEPHAVSPVGAQGVAQFMPWVAARMGLDNPFDPREALPMSAKLLRTLLEQFNNNFGLAAAAYNAGPKRILDWVAKRGKLPTETRNYVQKITGRPAEQWRKAKGVAQEFKTPERTRCHIVASRRVRNGAKFADVANIPLPPPRPGTEIVVADATGGPDRGRIESADMTTVGAIGTGQPEVTALLPSDSLGEPSIPEKAAGVVAEVSSPRTVEKTASPAPAVKKPAGAKTARTRMAPVKLTAGASVRAAKPRSLSPASVKKQTARRVKLAETR